MRSIERDICPIAQLYLLRLTIGVGAQSTFGGGGKTFLPENMHENVTKCPNFTRDLPEKLTKLKIENSRILHDICPKKKLTKCPNFTRFLRLPEKNSFCPNLRGGGSCLPLPPRLLRLCV